MFKKLLIFGFWLWASAASAQTMCPTRPSGDSSNACASTAFVGNTLNSPIFGAWLKAGQGTGVNATATGFSAATQALFLVGSYNGTGPGPYALISIDDTATKGAGVGFLNGLWIAHNLNAGAGVGARNALQVILTKNTAVPGTDPTQKFYSSIFGQTYVNAPDGGTAGTPLGQVYSVNSLTELHSGATNYAGVIGSEIDVSMQAGSSSRTKGVLSLIAVNSDAVKGSAHDAMLTLLRDTTTLTGWNLGIAFGRLDGMWPIDPATGTIIGTAPTLGTIGALNGVDFSSVTFSGCAFKSTGFCITPGGGVTTANAALTSAGAWTATSYAIGGALISRDANFLQITADAGRALSFGVNNTVDVIRIEATGNLIPVLSGVRNLGGAPNMWANVYSSAYTLAQPFAINTAPTISSGFCTSPSVRAGANGTLAFEINVGSACATGSGVIAMPTATNSWVCNFQDITSPGTSVIAMTGRTTNTVTVQDYSRTTGNTINFTSGDVIDVTCTGY